MEFQEGLNRPVAEFMQSQVGTIVRGTTVSAVARQLLSGQVSGIPVVEEDGTVVGIVTEFDVLEALLDGKDLQQLRTEEIMSTPPVCVGEQTSLLQVLQLMVTHRILRVLVVREGKLVGTVSRTILLREVLEKESASIHELTLCYWCERVRDDFITDEDKEVWCDLSDYLDRHHLTTAEVSFHPAFCSTCAPLVKTLMKREP